MKDNHRDETEPSAAPGSQRTKRAYRSPQLTEYGSVEDLVDAGVVGSVSVPSVTKMKPPPAL